MIKFANQLRAEMERGLDEVAMKYDREAQRSKASFEIVIRAVLQLREFMKTYEFNDPGEEIRFFKDIKPGFEHLAIYYGELVYIQTSKPIGDKQEVVRHLQKAIGINNDFINRHALLYSYYHLGHTAEDDRLFVRNGLPASLYPLYSDATDTSFSSQSSELLSKLLAYEKVNDYLVREIEYLETGLRAPQVNQEFTIDDIVWTDSKSNLIELAYALHSSGSLNQGKCQIQQIVTALEMVFKVKAGNFYRTFQSMRLRKKNRTAFLDSAKESLIKRMDDTDLSY
ncbi:RteC domain-containing protein [uncultured Pedobacter sp.]|uniref:RteC domain-containing protein n=1 Tax=uncultured Pedobacter sp. TaxID=246139 RepID=UPI00262DF272|nr:RteC domain-containing protein [uncultured Pedobacter sp.]